RMHRTACRGEEDRHRYRDTAIANQCTQETKHVSLHVSGKIGQAAQRTSCFHCAGVLPVKRLNTVEKCACALKPAAKATSTSGILLAVIITLARSMRLNSRYSRGR